MSTEQTKAAMVRAPFDYGAVTDDFGALKFTGGVSGTETTHSANAVPDDWRGKIVEITVLGGTAGTDFLHYAFSPRSAAEVDRSVAATAAGAAAKVGGIIPTGETRHVRIPQVQHPTATDGAVYFVRESSAVGMVAIVRLASP